MNIKLWSFLLLLILTLMNNYSQSRVDSLKSTLDDPSVSDSAKFINLEKLSARYIGRNLDSAAYYNVMAKNVAESIGDKSFQMRAKSTEAAINSNNWSIDTLMLIYNEVLAYNIAESDSNNIINTLLSMGALHSHRGLSKESIQYYVEAFNYAEPRKNYEQLGKITYNIGATYSNLTMMEEAKQKILEASKYFDLDGNKEFKGICLVSIADIFNNLSQLDSAKLYASEALYIGDSTKYVKLQSSARSALGAIHKNLEDYPEALNQYKMSLVYAERRKNNYTISNCHCNIGRIEYYLENYAKALAHFEKANTYEIFRNSEMSQHMCRKEYANTLFKLNREKEAFDNLNIYMQYQDTILRKENKTVVAELEAKYESLKKDTEIQNQLVKIRQQRSQQNYLFGGFSGVIVLASLIINRLRLKQRLSKQNLEIKEERITNLEQKQQLLVLDYIVQGQEEERKRIAKDLHDGLGGILSSAKLQLKSIEKEIEKIEGLKLFEQAEYLLENASQEVRRIAHDMMPDALMNLGLQSAVEDLADNLNLTEQLNVKTQFYLAGLILPEKYELMIYRIIQEVLSNTVKHAEATEVIIQLTANVDQLHMTIEDNGKGFDPEQVSSTKHIGIQNIKSRVNYLNGEVNLSSSSSNGTSYDMVFPLSQ